MKELTRRRPSMKRLTELITNPQTTTVTDPPIAQFLFGDVRMAWVWLPLRLWLGWTWLNSGWGKFNNPEWIGSGNAVKGFWERAVVVEPRPVIAFDWYREFLQLMLNAEAYTWFGKLITFGELAIGIGLILGAFVGIAAFAGG